MNRFRLYNMGTASTKRILPLMSGRCESAIFTRVSAKPRKLHFKRELHLYRHKKGANVALRAVKPGDICAE